MYLNVLSNNFSLSQLSKLNHIKTNISEVISSGKRINRVSDDAANSAISERMSKQINGLRQASRNSSEGISLFQVFETSLSKMEDILQKMREISIQSANGVFSDEERVNLNSEFKQLSSEIDRISSSTKFNGKAYLGIDHGEIKILLSDNITDTLQVEFKEINSDTLFTSPIDVLNQISAQNSITIIDNAIELVINHKSDLGSYIQRLNANINELSNNTTNLSSAKSRIIDTDFSIAISDLAKTEILTHSTISLLNKVNQSPTHILKLM